MEATEVDVEEAEEIKEDNEVAVDAAEDVVVIMLIVIAKIKL